MVERDTGSFMYGVDFPVSLFYSVGPGCPGYRAVSPWVFSSGPWVPWFL